MSQKYYGGTPDLEVRQAAESWNKLLAETRGLPNQGEILGIVHVLKNAEFIRGRCTPWPVVSDDVERMDWLQRRCSVLEMEGEEGVVVKLEYLEEDNDGEEITLPLPLGAEWPNLRNAIDAARDERSKHSEQKASER